MTIEELIYQQVEKMNSLKALQMLKTIYEHQESDGWCRLGYLDFIKMGIVPESIRRTLKLLQEKKLIEIADQERKKNQRGQLSHQYRVNLVDFGKKSTKKAVNKKVKTKNG